MMDFLVYDGKVAVALLVFYLFYRFLLKKETFHRFNRVVLVGTAVLSFLLPLCIITVHKPIEARRSLVADSPRLPVLGGSGFCAGQGDHLRPFHREDYPPGAAGPGRGWL